MTTSAERMARKRTRERRRLALLDRILALPEGQALAQRLEPSLTGVTDVSDVSDVTDGAPGKGTAPVAPPLPPASRSPDPSLSTPPKSPPKGHLRVAAMIDALRAEGMTGTLTGKDRQALLATQADPVEVAALYAAVFNGEYGDEFMHRKLSVGQCLEWLPGWRSHQAGHHAPQGGPWARSNGHAGAASGAAAVRAVFRKARDDAAAAVAGGRGGDGVGAGEAGAGLPRLLRD